MNRLRKIAMGVILLWLSVLYLQFVNDRASEKRIEAVLMIEPYIQVEVLDSKYVGKNPVIYGQEKKASYGYGFYKVTFRIENLSSKAYNSGINNIIQINESLNKVNTVIMPPIGEKEDYLCTLMPSIPGKTGVDLEYYMEVKDGTETLYVYYKTSFREDDTTTLEFTLDP